MGWKLVVSVTNIRLIKEFRLLYAEKLWVFFKTYGVQFLDLFDLIILSK